ncbi:beta-1,3-galactosyltransferase 6-like [Cimex lectularius]|uniref:Hexosyltransferase n=1 Tax=Cimex lectularius TaxID=79782 RepID=A0A8I6S4N2_CIMLE|nr:beta-1,3-galactosyltransferase 6-like [Cimex lectularius]
MRFRANHITHLLSFILGCGFTVTFFTFNFSPSIEIEKERFDIVLAVLSAPGNAERRDAIRDSWSSLIGPHTQYLFAIGGQGVTREQRFQIIQEQKLHGDLLILPVKDHYRNLTRKVLSVMTHLATTYKFKYVLKCDDDTFVNVKAVEASLKNMPERRFYWGYFSGTARVQKSGKWREDKWFLCDRYLPYALGGAYVLSGDLVLFISNNADQLSVYNSEDVSVGAWLAPLDITRRHDPRFDTAHVSRGCKNDDIAIHRQVPADIRAFGRRLADGKDLCEKEFSVVRPYRYNWSVLPSQCCTTFYE